MRAGHAPQAVTRVATCGNLIASGDTAGRVVILTVEGHILSTLATRGSTESLVWSPADGAPRQQHRQQLCVVGQGGVSMCSVGTSDAGAAVAHLTFDSTDGALLTCFWLGPGCLAAVFASSLIRVIATERDQLGTERASCQPMQAAIACALDAASGKLALASRHEV